MMVGVGESAEGIQQGLLEDRRWEKEGKGRA